MYQTSYTTLCEILSAMELQVGVFGYLQTTKVVKMQTKFILDLCAHVCGSFVHWATFMRVIFKIRLQQMQVMYEPEESWSQENPMSGGKWHCISENGPMSHILFFFFTEY